MDFPGHEKAPMARGHRGKSYKIVAENVCVGERLIFESTD